MSANDKSMGDQIADVLDLSDADRASLNESLDSIKDHIEPILRRATFWFLRANKACPNCGNKPGDDITNEALTCTGEYSADGATFKKMPVAGGNEWTALCAVCGTLV